MHSLVERAERVNRIIAVLFTCSTNEAVEGLADELAALAENRGDIWEAVNSLRRFADALERRM